MTTSGPSEPVAAATDPVVPGGETGAATPDLAAGTAAARQLVGLLEQLPALASRERVAGLLAEEVADALGSASVGVWHLPVGGGDGATCLGGVGLTSVEQQLALPLDQPAVAEAMQSHGAVVDQATADSTRVAGLPRLRQAVLLLVPVRGTPWGDLLVVAGLDSLVPEGFEQVESTVAAGEDVLALSAWLGRLADLLGAS